MEIERLGIDHDLASTRSEDPDERTDRRQVERPEWLPGHHVDLVLPDTVDVLDDPEVAAVDVADGHPDHLVPVHLAAREVTQRVNDCLQVRTPQGVGRVAARDLAESDAPAGSIGDRFG